MEMKAAVFRKVHETLTIEAVEIDEPRGREVLVRTVATGVCHSDLHVVDGLGRFVRGQLDDINDAFRAMKAGEVARSALTFD